MSFKKTFAIVVLLFLMSSVIAQEKGKTDTFNITGHTMRFPQHPSKWGFRIAAGLSMVKPPKDLLENAIQAPLVNIHMVFGLPWKFSLEGDVTTIVVSNQMALGPRLGFSVKDFSFNIGYDMAFVYGQLRQFGFDNNTKVWIGYPNISLGYKLKKMAFTLKMEAVTLINVVQSSGENDIVRTKNYFNGFTAAVYIEQRLWKDHIFIIGFKDNYEKFYWPTWMLFTTFNRFYHIPELSFSWIL